MRRRIVGVIGALVVLTAVAPSAEAGRGYRRAGSFWGGFAAGAITGAVAGALLGPPAPVVVGPPPVVMAPPRYARPRRVWVPGAYVVRYRPGGTPYRVWRRGYGRPY